MTRNLKPSVRSRCSLPSFFIPLPKILYTFSSSTDTLSLSAEWAKNLDFSPLSRRRFPAPGSAPWRCRGETKASAVGEPEGALAFSTKLPSERNYSPNRRRLRGWATQRSRGGSFRPCRAPSSSPARTMSLSSPALPDWRKKESSQ